MHINIVIPYYKNLKTIDKVLESLEDQDYKDFDVLITVDGKKGDDGIDNSLIEKYPDLKCVLLKNNKNVGAGLNRNRGAKEIKNKGDILFFLDADCYLMPGMLSEFESKFAMNPDIDFLYGNYRYKDESLSTFISQPFDFKALETYNYISTMSPMKWKCFDSVKGFRDKPYFQDYDLFYRISKAGFIGEWLNDVLFETEVSDKDSISGDITLSQSEKCKNFREWNGIKDKEIVVTTFGMPYQAKQRAEMLGEDYLGTIEGTRRAVFPYNLQFENWKYTYIMGLFNESREAFNNHIQLVSPGTRPIYHFVGTDVFHMMNFHSIRDIKMFKSALKEQNAVLLANCESLRDELKECGFNNVKVVYTPIKDIQKYIDNRTVLPEDFSIAVYISDSNPMHMLKNPRSHITMIHDIALSLPFIKFKFFGGEAVHESKNIQQCGIINNIPDFINDCSAYLRLTIHDGFPQLPIQFLLSGRNVITNSKECDYALKGCLKVPWQEWIMEEGGYEKAKEDLINQILSLYNDPGIRFNQEEIDNYYLNLMSPDKYKENIYSAISIFDACSGDKAE